MANILDLDALAALIGEAVVVTFADGHTERGTYRGGHQADRHTVIDVELRAMYGGREIYWTASFSTLATDADTPPMVTVEADREATLPQAETLFA